MLADDVLQPMYELAYFLHPDPAVALTVTLDAADRLALLRRLREHPIGHAWRRLPEAWLPQYCVYLASDRPERAHERPRPDRAPRERPTRDDYLVRYLKCLVWWTMALHGLSCGRGAGLLPLPLSAGCPRAAGPGAV